MSALSRLDRLGESKLWLFEANSIMLDFKFEPIIAYLSESKDMINAKEIELRKKIDEWELKHQSFPEAPEAYDYFELYRVLDFQEVRSFLLRIIGGMTFTLETTDKSHPIFEFTGIPKSDIDLYIRELVERNRSRKNVYVAE